MYLLGCAWKSKRFHTVLSKPKKNNNVKLQTLINANNNKKSLRPCPSRVLGDWTLAKGRSRKKSTQDGCTVYWSYTWGGSPRVKKTQFVLNCRPKSRHAEMRRNASESRAIENSSSNDDIRSLTYIKRFKMRWYHDDRNAHTLINVQLLTEWSTWFESN